MGIEKIGQDTAGTKPNRSRSLRRGAVVAGGLALTATTLAACTGLGAAGPIQIGLTCGKGYDNEFYSKPFDAAAARPTGRTAPVAGSGNIGSFYKVIDGGNGNTDNTFALVKLLDIDSAGNETFALLDGTLTTTSDGKTTTLQGSDPGAETDLPGATDTSVQVSGKIGSLLGVIDPEHNAVGVYAGAALSSSTGATPAGDTIPGLSAYCNYPKPQ